MTDEPNEAEGQVAGTPPTHEAENASNPTAAPEMTAEDRAYLDRVEAHQEALRTGGGDTRVTPIDPSRANEPLIVWPLEQATVPVSVHRPGATMVIENANPVAPPIATATGVTAENSTGPDDRSALHEALEGQDVPVVDIAAESTETPEEAVVADPDHEETPNQ